MSTRLTELDDRLRGVGVETVLDPASVESMAAKASDLVGLSPTIAGSAVLASCGMSAPAQWRRARRLAIRESPVGHLIRLDHPGP